MSAWNEWFHLMASTYGTWLPGDPRGFRTRGHREHVEGDYKNPPPEGAHDQRLQRAKRLLKDEPVVLSVEARHVAAKALVAALLFHEIETLTAAVSGMHLHVVARFPVSLKRKPTLSERGLRSSSIDDPPRHYLGIAKQTSAKVLYRSQLVSSPKVWARRGKIVRIKDRPHQLNVFNYIRDHQNKGAAVWCFRDPPPPPIDTRSRWDTNSDQQKKPTL